LHDTAKSVQNSLGGKILRRNQIDEVLLAGFLLLPSSQILNADQIVAHWLEIAHFFDNVENSGIGFREVSGQELSQLLVTRTQTAVGILARAG
jgi:hypothetical protein